MIRTYQLSARKKELNLPKLSAVFIAGNELKRKARLLSLLECLIEAVEKLSGSV